MFLFRGVLRQRTEDLPLDNITSIREKKGVVLGSLVVLASSTELVITHMSKLDQRALVTALRARLTTGSFPPLPPFDLDLVMAEEEGDESPSNDALDSVEFVDRLRELAQLRTEGILSDTEFEAAKARIIEAM
jgi:hypothetical protein